MIRFVSSRFLVVALVCSLGLLVVPTQPVSAGLGGGELPGDWPEFVRLWPDGRIPILISGSFKEEELKIIWKALNKWCDQTGNAVWFDPIEEVPPDNANFVHLMTRQEWILTDYGKVGEQPLCGSWGASHTKVPTYTWLHQKDGSNDNADCVNVPSILHEIGHAIGLGHEQLRPDRDFYIEFQNPYQNPYDSNDKGPDPWPENTEPAPVGFFDFYSFMHTQTEHGTPKAPDIRWPLPWANWGGPSDGDIDTVRALYAFDIGYDQDITGGDYAHLILALHRDCMLAWAADVRCQAYTYVSIGVKDNTPHCYLKDDGSIPLSGQTGMHSGKRKPDQKCSFGVALNVDLVGGQLSDGVVSMPHNLLNGNNCKDLCAQDPMCDAFTFVPGDVNGACYKKTHNPDPPEPSFEYKVQDGSMSGVVRGVNEPLNLAPASDAGGPYTAEWASIPDTDPPTAAGPVPLNGTGSDPEGSPLTYFWTTDCPKAVFDDPRNSQTTMWVHAFNTPPICSTQCNVSLIVTDDQCFRSSRSTSTVTIQDTTPPALIGVPADQTLECGAIIPVPAHVTATDSYDPSVVPTFTETRVDGSCTANYTLERTWTAVDDCRNSTSASQTITVQDTVGPIISCNSPWFMSPPQAPISFTATARDTCSSVTAVQITGFNCVGKKGNSKLESCVVTFSGSTITIQDTGGVGNTISWTVEATDSCGNTKQRSCQIVVANPILFRP